MKQFASFASQGGRRTEDGQFLAWHRRGMSHCFSVIHPTAVLHPRAKLDPSVRVRTRLRVYALWSRIAYDEKANRVCGSERDSFYVAHGGWQGVSSAPSGSNFVATQRLLRNCL